MQSCGLFYFCFSEEDVCNEIKVAKFGSVLGREIVSV